jgi:phosphoglycerol transferase MdoB-like AlkP superfamily enzyme
LDKFFPPVAVCALIAILLWLPRRQNILLWSLSLALWLVGSNLWKVALIQEHLDSPVDLPAIQWAWQACSLAGCVLICQCISRHHWHRLVWILQATLATLFLFDQLYERYFDDVPGMYLLTQLSQAKSVIPSAIELLRREDLAFPLDVLVAIPLLFYRAPLAPSRRETSAMLLVPLTLCLFMGAMMDAEDRRILRLRFRNVAAVQRLGLFHYHFYDVLQMAYSRYENLLDPTYDRALLSQIVHKSRLSIQAPTPFKGRYRGKNLLIFQLESFEAFVHNLKIDGQEVTPFLNELARESWTAGLQDQSGQGRSSDGEFILLNSLLPPGERPLVYAYPSNFYAGLPAQLAQQGYFTSYAVAYYGSFWNCRYMAKRYGFKKNLFREQIPNDPNHTIGWGLSDLGLVNRIQVYWAEFQRPLFAYTVTMMGHHPYRELTPSQEKLKLPPRFDDTMLARYLQLCRERDEEWREIVALLKQKGLWDTSVVVLVGDHDARIPYEEMALLTPDGKFDEVDKILSDRVFCLIHAPDGKLRGSAPSYAAQVDLTPTLLHLLGQAERPTATLGLNLLSPIKRNAIVSKTGYSLDDEYIVVDNGSSWSTYARSTHCEVQRNGVAAQKEMQQWYDLTRDILRLNLVHTMLQMP